MPMKVLQPNEFNFKDKIKENTNPNPVKYDMKRKFTKSPPVAPLVNSKSSSKNELLNIYIAKNTNIT